MFKCLYIRIDSMKSKVLTDSLEQDIMLLSLDQRIFFSCFDSLRLLCKNKYKHTVLSN